MPPNISTIYIYNKTSIKRNILTIKKIHLEIGRAKDLSAPRVIKSDIGNLCCHGIILNLHIWHVVNNKHN
jgi:hypothetical protein